MVVATRVGEEVEKGVAHKEREEGDAGERERGGEERERETLRLFFLNLNDYITSLFIVLRRLAS
jgi:hypothetical protein